MSKIFFSTILILFSSKLIWEKPILKAGIMDTTYYEFFTPDKNKFKFRCVFKKEEVDRLIDEPGTTRLEDTRQMETYKLAGGEIMVRKFFKKDLYLLFDDVREFNKYVGGKSYNWVFIKFNKNKPLYVYYWLDPIATIEIKKQIERELHEYESIEGYHAFLLKDSSVAFLTPRTPEFSDGYWYPTLSDFINTYLDISEPKRSSPTKEL